MSSQCYFFTKQILPDGLDYFQVGRGDDDEGKDEAEQVDEDDVGDGEVGGVSPPCPHHPTATDIRRNCGTSEVAPGLYLTPRELRPNVPNPRRGGKDTRKEYIQMKTNVVRVEQEVDNGNCLSLELIPFHHWHDYSLKKCRSNAADAYNKKEWPQTTERERVTEVEALS